MKISQLSDCTSVTISVSADDHDVNCRSSIEDHFCDFSDMWAHSLAEKSPTGVVASSLTIPRILQPKVGSHLSFRAAGNEAVCQ